MCHTGQKFGRWTLKKFIKKDKRYCQFWLCRCDCGTERIVNVSMLRKGQSKSCGCLKRDNIDEKRLNYIGKEFGCWTILEFVRPYVGGNVYVARCICGVEKEVNISALKKGKSKSCGCQNRVGDGMAPAWQTFIKYKRKARVRNLCFELTFDEFLKISQQKCTYCNSEKSNIHKNPHTTGDFHYNGIDRKNNKLGYRLENCVPSCKICNRAKSDMDMADFMEWAKNLAKKSI